MHRVTRLPNGVTVATAAMPHMNSVSVGVWIGAGGRHEEERLNGVSHFIEHMLFKGTRERSARQISEQIEGIGGYINAYTSEELTCYYCRAGADRMGDLVEVLMDMALNSRFATSEIDKERQVIKEELLMYLDQPSQHVLEVLNEVTWPDHPLGRCLTGTEDSLDYLRRPQLTRYKNRHYVSENTIICAAGNLDHDRFVRRVNRFAKHIPQGRGPSPVPAPPRTAHRSPRWRQLKKPSEQTNLAIGMLTCSRHDAARDACRILNTVLGENMSSRLFQAVREDRGLAYNIYSSLGFYDDTGVLTIAAGLDPQHLEPTIQILTTELKRLSQELLSPAELKRAKDYLIGQLQLSLENTDNRMTWLAENWLFYQRVPDDQAVIARLKRVRAHQVRQLAQQIFTPDNLHVAAIAGAAIPKRTQSLLLNLA